MQIHRKNLTILLSCLSLVMAAVPLMAKAATAKYKIYLSMSYIGNDWQAEAANMVKAMAQTPALKDKVQLEVQVAGPNAQKQIQQINAMVQAGAQAIVVYPISPTALNQVIKNACSKGVKIFAYDGEVTEPCAHNVTIDQKEAGTVTAQWLAKKLDGKGNVVMITGVPGTSVDKQRTEAAKAVFAKYPGIKIVGETPGMWSQAVARTELSKLIAVRGWDKINGLWMQVGCYTANAMQLESGRKAKDLLPCAGEGSNGGRVQMLPVGTKVDGAHGSYAPQGAQRFSYASPPYSGALALKLAVEALDGKTVPNRVTLPLPQITNANVKLCTSGSWSDMKNGCNTFQPASVKNPGWFASIYSDQTEGLGLNAALSAKPDSSK
ncbi:sugar ABC transporter substrate-binding protein [Paralcaligenes ureilyticus]|uniref:Monosaccharide ABC transporter substrate-binding protein (CUT2 family) n=1 Tax=Paralcaligenes ureilyticus TaxID=627131 RepID=A0A4V2UYX7_9BURK|nr:sugar ABC transporter substrate-binding protein [Paralcaligenes ureilyticus]TCT09098.1 monosaccharide ABC transporter substrate-binding protein (CUT2 family) [Paralcaligenes ureilyticus]